MAMAVRMSVIVGMSVIHARMLYYNITEVHAWARSQLRVLAALIARVLRRFHPQREGAGDPQGRAQGRPGARCTRGLACKKRKQDAHEHTGSAEAVRPSLRNGFNGFLRALPGDRLSCHRRHAGMNPPDLTPASGRQDHTTSPSAIQPRSSVVAIPSIASHRTFVTIASRPSCRVGWPMEDVIWVRTTAEYFRWAYWTQHWCNWPDGQHRDW